MGFNRLVGVAVVAAATVVSGIGAPVATAATVPGAPTDVHGLWTSGDGERVAIAWTAPAESGGALILGYTLRATTDDGATWLDLGTREDCTPVELSCVAETSKVVSYTLDMYTTYRFQARAINEIGAGPWSDLGPRFTTLPGGRPRPLAPRDFSQITQDNAMLLRWSAPPDPVGWGFSYEIAWTIRGESVPFTHTASTRARSYLIIGLDPAKTTQVRIRTVRAGTDDVEVSPWLITGWIRAGANPQRIVGFAGLPRVVARTGRTQILPCGVRTNAGRDVRVYLTWTGPRWRAVDDDAVIVRRSDCGGVTVITKGQPVRITVGLWAAPAQPWDGMVKVRIYKTWESAK